MLLEGKKSNTLESVKIAGVEIGPAYPVGVAKRHHKARIIFEQILAYQIVDESYTGGNSGDIHCKGDTGKIAVYEKSRFLTQVTKNRIIPLTVDGPVRDYCIWSEDYVIDVISTIEELS